MLKIEKQIKWKTLFDILIWWLSGIKRNPRNYFQEIQQNQFFQNYIHCGHLNNIFLNQLLRFIIEDGYLEDGDYCREDCEDCRDVKNHSSEVSEKKTV